MPFREFSKTLEPDLQIVLQKRSISAYLLWRTEREEYGKIVTSSCRYFHRPGQRVKIAGILGIAFGETTRYEGKN